jgi:integrase
MGKEGMSRYRVLAEIVEGWNQNDNEFARFIQNFKSKGTQRTYCYTLARFYDKTGIAPKQIVESYQADGEKRRQFLDDLDTYITGLVKEEKYGTAHNAWAVITSLLEHRRVLHSISMFEVKYPENELLSPQYIPTQEEFEAMLRCAESARNRFAISFFRYGGGRVGVIEDPEPMKLSNILDLVLGSLAEGVVRFNHSSSCAILFYEAFQDGQITRHKEAYVTFIPPQTMTLLKEYLELRMRSGERLRGDSFVFTPDRQEHAENRTKLAKPYVSTKQMQRMVATASKRAGFVVKKGNCMRAKFTTHSLRRLFYNSLQGLDDVDKECLQGHISGVKRHYHGSVDEMAKVIELMRGKYEFGMRAYIAGKEEDQRKRAILDFARMQGISDEEINGIQNMLEKRKLGHMVTTDDLLRALREFDDAKKRQVTKTTMTDGGKVCSALLVKEDALVDYLEMGWEVVRELSDGQIAIRKSSK